VNARSVSVILQIIPTVDGAIFSVSSQAEQHGDGLNQHGQPAVEPMAHPAGEVGFDSAVTINQPRRTQIPL
jgi:hypothetical protein